MNHETKAQPLDDHDLGEVIRRAHEIQSMTGLMLEPHPELENYLRAADEVGLPRDAVLQALRERLSFPAEAYEEGQTVFAKSADDRFYAARVLETKGRNAEVRFLNGSDHTCDITDLRFFSLTPGQRVQYHSPSYKMWCDGSVVRYNREASSVTLNSWGTEETVPIDQIRLPKQRKPGVQVLEMAQVYWYTIGAALAGGAIGVFVMKLLTR